ncbi:tRNA lysidine(34) synthetase TilS [Pollutimonas nitritireducens]|uniref:tRNA(Ile)-lysidine synthase n=1 Tax=Pollutimonas nitritireducens TaxID=2045209 RepID=A0A2N4UJP8_9BURK|nr:tRNA lysidine(34) synthetase TilS [Pollutimonas nitritireducens]PLC55246.1 tRNA lysidine(34) synthetase TilS [Pollutimonas nitritireducens]
MPSDDFWKGFGSASLLRAVADALTALPQPSERIAVALSGGTDSAMLAVHAAILARRRKLTLHCFHVHHGLQEPAAQWQAHVHDLAHWLQIPCHSMLVRVDMSAGVGMEAAARDARYEALRSMAVQTDVEHILLAHHRNDQAETVMLRLLRGSGPTGLAAMAPTMKRHGMTYLRPWLDIDRVAILEQASQFFTVSGWAPVDDPSNVNDKYTRAAVRERLVPALNERWPGWQRNVVRHARQSAQVQEVLDEVAAQDFAGLSPTDNAGSFALAGWRQLSQARQALVLRYWLALHGLRMPTDARLQDVMRQLRGLHAMGHDRQMQVKHGAVWIRCVQGRVLLDIDPTGPVFLSTENSNVEKR